MSNSKSDQTVTGNPKVAYVTDAEPRQDQHGDGKWRLFQRTLLTVVMT